MSNNRLQGEISSSIYTLPYIETLKVDNNPDLVLSLEGISQSQYLKHLSFSKTSVTSIENLSNAASLEVLHMTDLKLTGPIPQSLFTLTNLKALYANYNSFTGPLPTDVGKLTKLEELNLYDSNLTGQLPSDLGRLTLLKILTLTDNAFDGSLPAGAFEQMTNLQMVSIQRIGLGLDGTYKGNGITGPVPAFRNHRFLTKVQLENQMLDGNLDTDFLLNSPTGEGIEVDLRNNQITGSVPSSLTDKRFLSLYLGGNQITSVPNQIYNPNTQTCSQISDWMNGDITDYGCNAFLCPPGTWAPQGRAMSLNTGCASCGDDSTHWGRTECRSSTTGAQREREILLNFYNFLGGRNWKNDEGWLDLDTNYCNWYGVSCDPNTGRIISIILRNNGLIGSVPDDVFELQSLETLNLESNDITFDFTSLAGASAANLQSLDLSSTGLTVSARSCQLGISP